MEKTMSGFLKESEQWSEEIKQLRTISKKLELDEELKWGKPCYCFEGKNIAVIQPFKKFLGLMFFKGKLLKDKEKILVDNGPNSQSAMRMEFLSVKDVKAHSKAIKAYLKEAIQIEKSGLKADFKKNQEPLPAELVSIFKRDAKFKKAFKSLTPGRQRGYILHFSSAKQSSTRISRIEKAKAKIMEGKGLTDR